MTIATNSMLLALSTFLVGALIAPLESALAQDASEQDVEEIVITAKRQVNESLANIKYEQDGVVDSLTFAQIAMVPDTSLAEVLDRVVGVSSVIGFNSSQPRTITVRGFDARYNSMSIDGNPVWNSSRNNRGTQLDVFPASVINQVDAFKTPNAAQDANSIGAHIEMRTLRAFDGGTQPLVRLNAAVGSFEQEGLPVSDIMPFRMDGAGKFTFGSDNQFGLVLGFDYQEQGLYDDHNEVSGYSQIGGIDVVSGLLNVGIYQSQFDRQSVYAKLEARESDKLYAFVSANVFNESRSDTFNDTGIFVSSANVTNAGIGRGDFTNGTSVVQFEDYGLFRDTTMLSTGLDYRLADVSSIELRAGYTNYDHDEFFNRSTQWRNFGLVGSYNITDDNPIVTLDAASAASLTPDNLAARTGRGFDFLIPHEDDVTSLSAVFNHNSHATSEGLGFVGGILLRRMKRNFDQTFNTVGFQAGSTFTLADHSNGSYQTAGIPVFFADLPSYQNDTVLLASDPSRTADYDLVEDVYAAHAVVVSDWGKLRLTAGARIEYTDLINSTADLVDGVVSDVTRRKTYTDILPNVQVVYEASESLRFRAAYTEAIARPDFADFAFGQRQSIDGNGFPVIAGTNPNLEARKSNNVDFSVEKYFDDGFVSFGLFYKELKDEIFTQRIETLNDQGVVILTETFPLNNSSGDLTGVELSFVNDSFEILDGTFLSGLGVNTNLTWLDGTWNVTFQDGATRSVDGLRNQPEWLASLGAYYKWERLTAGATWRLRGDTFTGTFGTTSDRDIYVDSYDRLDLHLAYQVTDALEAYVQVKNVTDTFYVEQTGINRVMSVSNNAGRFLWFGVRYEL